MNLYAVVFSYLGYGRCPQAKADLTFALIRTENYFAAKQQAAVYAEQKRVELVSVNFIDETKINNKLLLVYED